MPLNPIIGQRALDGLTADVLPERVVLSTVFAGSSAWGMPDELNGPLAGLAADGARSTDHLNGSPDVLPSSEHLAGLAADVARSTDHLNGSPDLLQSSEHLAGLTADPQSTVPPRADAGWEFPGSGTGWEQQFAVSDGHGSTAYYTCQFTHSEGTQGLLGFVGLGPPPQSTAVCMPAAVVTH